MQPQPQQYSPRPGFQEMASNNVAVPMTAAVPMRPAGAPPGVQEMNAQQQAVPMRPVGPPPGMQEMSAASNGGVNRPPGPPPGQQVQRFDMNGNPMSEFHGAELE